MDWHWTKFLIFTSVLTLLFTAKIQMLDADGIIVQASDGSNLLDAASDTAPPNQTTIQNQDDSAVESLRYHARAIAVKVLSGNAWGSGIIIQRQQEIYTVVTNEHVLQMGDKYRIQTHDGKIYQASLYTTANFNGNDLGILQFKSVDTSYEVASLGDSASLNLGDEVFAAGFPFERDASQPDGFSFTVGKISLLAEKALEQGYQVGYTNNIQKGMSGGPVLNQSGEVVAINGMHAYPLWGDPYIYKDGSKPCLPMRNLMVHLAFAIPIQTFVRLAPKSLAITQPKLNRPFSPAIENYTISNTNFGQLFPYGHWLLQEQANSARRCN